MYSLYWTPSPYLSPLESSSIRTSLSLSEPPSLPGHPALCTSRATQCTSSRPPGWTSAPATRTSQEEQQEERQHGRFFPRASLHTNKKRFPPNKQNTHTDFTQYTGSHTFDPFVSELCRQKPWNCIDSWNIIRTSIENIGDWWPSLDVWRFHSFRPLDGRDFLLVAERWKTFVETQAEDPFLKQWCFGRGDRILGPGATQKKPSSSAVPCSSPHFGIDVFH